MRKYLNNPALLYRSHSLLCCGSVTSYGLLDQLLPDFSDQPQPLAVTQVAVEEESVCINYERSSHAGLSP